MVINRAGGVLPDFFMAFSQETAPDCVNGGTSDMDGSFYLWYILYSI